MGASELTLRLGDRDLTPDLAIYRDLEIDFTQDELRMTNPATDITVDLAEVFTTA